MKKQVIYWQLIPVAGFLEVRGKFDDQRSGREMSPELYVFIFVVGAVSALIYAVAISKRRVK